MTLTKGGILAIIRGIFEGIFGLLLLFAAGLSANLPLVLLILLAVYLILILLDQQDNVFELIGIVIGGFIAVALRTIDGGSAMAYVAVLVIVIVLRWLPPQKSQG